MFRSVFASALAAVLIAPTMPAYAAQLMVKDIAVTVDPGAVANTDAAKYWANLGDELNAAIAARVADRIAADGVHILVKISSAALATRFMGANGKPEPHLIGVVNIVGSPSASGEGSTQQGTAGKKSNYELTISFKDAVSFVPAGVDVMTITPDRKEYHDAMIAAFADYVAKNL